MGTERTRIDLAASRSGRGRRDLKDRELLPAANLPRHATVSASMLPLWSAFKKSPQSRASLTLSVGLKTTPTPTLPCLSCSTARRKTRETRAWHIPHKTLRRSLARFRPRCDVQSSFVACEGRGPPPSHSQSFLPWDRCWHALGPACWGWHGRECVGGELPRSLVLQHANSDVIASRPTWRRHATAQPCARALAGLGRHPRWR